MSRTSAAVIVVLFSMQATVMGLIAPPWTFDDLRAKSDLIVIAQRISTRDAGFTSEFTELQPPFPVVELNSDFKVLTALQGTPGRATVVLRHYRQDTERLPGPVLNAPLGLNFSTEPTAVYLLFLKHQPDDLYAPTSGHVFPEFSVLALPKGPLTVFPR